MGAGERGECRVEMGAPRAIPFPPPLSLSFAAGVGARPAPPRPARGALSLSEPPSRAAPGESKRNKIPSFGKATRGARERGGPACSTQPVQAAFVDAKNVPLDFFLGLFMNIPTI
jgi:hypothetical protein